MKAHFKQKAHLHFVPISSTASACVLYVFSKDLSHTSTAGKVQVLGEVCSVFMETRHYSLILKKAVMVELNYFSYVEIKSAVHHGVYTEI